MTTGRKALLVAAIVIAIVALVLLGRRRAPTPGSLVFVQVPPGSARGGAGEPDAWPWHLPSGGRLVLLAPDGDAPRLEALTRRFEAACDPSLSTDGCRLVFAGKQRADDPWQIWEMKARGGRARRVAAFHGDCAGPIFVPENGEGSSPTYVPDGRLLFAGRSMPAASGPGSAVPTQSVAPAAPGAWQLYSCRRDGSDLTQLTHGTSPTYDPAMLRDGRVVFATWHWRHLGGPAPPLGAIWHLQQDGTGVDGLCPGPEGYLKSSPVEVEDRLFFVATDSATAAGGRLASVALNRPFTTYAEAAPDADGEFQSAYPLAQGRLVVSYRPPDPGATFGLYELDYVKGELGRVIYDDPDYDDIDPVVVGSRTPPHGHVTVMVPGKTTGELYCLNVYESQLPNVRELAPDGIKQVRVYEAAGTPPEAPPIALVSLEPAQLGPPEGAEATRLLGEAPVEADGSFYVEVPADRPLRWELLDAAGDVVARAPVSVWVRPFEHRGCVGCHAPRHRAADNFIPQAVARKPTPLGVERKAEIVGFREDIMPMIEARCATVACHGPGGEGEPTFSAEPAQAPDGTPVNAAYAALVYTADPQTKAPRWVHPGSAGTSRLLTTMSVHARRDRVELDADQLKMLKKWIDGGAHWDAAGGHGPPTADQPTDTYREGGP